MSEITTPAAGRMRSRRRARTTFVAVGALAGLAWAAALRAWMAELNGLMSAFSWGTFVGVLLPGVVVGAAFGWAAVVGDDATPGERRMLRWCAAAPLAFAVAPLAVPGALVDLLTQGLGGGAAAIALLAVLGGFGFDGGRPRWPRAVAGALAVGFSVAVALLTGPLLRGEVLGLASPRGAWLAVFDLALLLLLIAAASIPFRRLRASRDRARS
ncbi:hypothetical protein GE115_10335 [Agromyces sp. CFH 90414]|uniref:Uncharacterized protein n=1 Tax=Agromyces agglutinans TaxID=2662258 RepID=A0A6I2F6C5_9MICO|nr:hypothetical protein [Agromyces agglutinans]MRG60262.1 hypothetical protein [Agromyces agglutinans]